MKKITLFLLLCVSLTSFAQDGTIDESFNTGDGVDGMIRVVRVLENGKILCGGDFSSYDGNNVNSIARLNPDGSYDDAFNTAVSNHSVSDILVEDDGKIILANYYSQLIRLNENGSLDNSFNLLIFEAASGHGVSKIKKQGEKYIVSGQFDLTTPNNNNYKNIARLNPDGSLDSTFTPVSLAFFNDLYEINIEVQADGKIFVMGFIQGINNIPVSGIARLNADGTFDDTFAVSLGGVTEPAVNVMALQPDGKYIISGYFTTVNGLSRYMVARLNNNGATDETFLMDPEDAIAATKIIVQPDHKILITGSTTYFNQDRLFLRFNPDGGLDNDFNVYTGFNSYVLDIELSDDGKVVAGGWFTKFNGMVTCNGIARLNNTVLGAENFVQKTTSVYPNPTNDKVFLSNTFEGVVGVKLFDITGKMLFERTVADSNEVADLSGYAKGVYFMQLTSGGKTFTQKVLKN